MTENRFATDGEVLSVVGRPHGWRTSDVSPFSSEMRLSKLFFPDFQHKVELGSVSLPGNARADLGSGRPRALLSFWLASYLVDPASSHMLVSKIKPCMSKYKPH